MEIESGSCFVIIIAFEERYGASKAIYHPVEGKPRPVVVLKDPIEDRYYAHNVTKRVSNPFNQRNGYQLRDWKESGFHRESIVKCDQHNVFEITPDALREPFGKLSERDLTGFLQQLNKVRQREIANDQEMER